MSGVPPETSVEFHPDPGVDWICSAVRRTGYMRKALIAPS